MPPLPGWDHPGVRRRRDQMRAALISLPSPAERVSASATSARSLLPRLALLLTIGALVVLFGMATDSTRVAVVAVPAMVVAVLWRQLSWPVRVLVMVGVLWLSLAELGQALGLGLYVLLITWWWLPAQVGPDGSAGAASGRGEAGPAAPKMPDLVLAARGPEQPAGIHVPMSLRRFAEERSLSEAEVAMLASIRFPGEPPRSAARWHHIYNAIRLSRWLDKDD